ncbi:hypothetical protein PYCC9005_000913 [Savitreella phatthalungensis]
MSSPESAADAHMSDAESSDGHDSNSDKGSDVSWRTSQLKSSSKKPQQKDTSNGIDVESPLVENGDAQKPVFLKMAFGRAAKQEIVNPMIESTEQHDARPWTERTDTIPFMVVFRNTFAELFEGLPHFGPQDIEEMLEEPKPGPIIMEFFCRMLTLVNDRTKPVENPNYNRALQTYLQSLPLPRQDPKYAGYGPHPVLVADNKFTDLDVRDRLWILESLVDSCLSECKRFRERIDEAYRLRYAIETGKVSNALEVPSIGLDDSKNVYYLVRGFGHTRFRLYVQTDPAKETQQWYAVAGDVPSMRTLIDKLADSTQTLRGRKLVKHLREDLLPDLEACEQARAEEEHRRKRAEQARDRRAALSSHLYESPRDRSMRTRGRRVDYAEVENGYRSHGNGYDDGESSYSASSPRSARLAGMTTTTTTTSGRRVRRTRRHFDFGDDENDDDEEEDEGDEKHSEYGDDDNDDNHDHDEADETEDEDVDEMLDDEEEEELRKRKTLVVKCRLDPAQLKRALEAAAWRAARPEPKIPPPPPAQLQQPATTSAAAVPTTAASTTLKTSSTEPRVSSKYWPTTSGIADPAPLTAQAEQERESEPAKVEVKNGESDAGRTIEDAPKPLAQSDSISQLQSAVEPKAEQAPAQSRTASEDEQQKMGIPHGIDAEGPNRTVSSIPLGRPES